MPSLFAKSALLGALLAVFFTANAGAQEAHSDVVATLQRMEYNEEIGEQILRYLESEGYDLSSGTELAIRSLGEQQTMVAVAWEALCQSDASPEIAALALNASGNDEALGYAIERFDVRACEPLEHREPEYGGGYRASVGSVSVSN